MEEISKVYEDCPNAFPSYDDDQNFLLLFDKSIGMTSNFALQKVKRLFKLKKIGYSGTLDPFATGLLVLGAGKYTKHLHDITNFDKEYQFVMEFGKATDSHDIDGIVTEIREENIPSLLELEKAIRENFMGEIAQIPPEFSAVKIAGKRMCDIARKSGIKSITPEQMQSKERIVNIKKFEVLKQIDHKTFLLEVHCSKGTYIRSLVRDIAKRLNSVAYTKELKRTAVGEYKLSNSFYRNF